jgi:CRISPR/Cas system CSM-associated protein Csm3 (group 7 of RAMP superfamily)
MFRALHNQATIVLKLQPVTPLLIKAPGASLDPTRPELEFVTTGTDVGRVEYIPGSTLKGVMRSFAERLLLAIGRRACDPTERKSPCSDREHRAYARQCDACKLFGSPNLAGRLRVADGLPWRPGASGDERVAGRDALQREVRTSVSLDRATGAASNKGLMEMDVLVGGALYPELSLRNYQLWQLAMTGLAIDEITRGYQQIGSGKSRGLGRMSCQIESFEIRQNGALANPDEVRGTGCVPGDAMKAYHLGDADSCPLPEGLSPFRAGPLSTARFVADEARRLMDALLGGEAWRRFLDVAR